MLRYFLRRGKSLLRYAVMANRNRFQRPKIGNAAGGLHSLDIGTVKITHQRPWSWPVRRLFCCAMFFAIGLPASALASSLQVAPVTLELPPGAKASQLTLQNLGTTPIDAQIRVFRWTQKDGEEQLTPSTDMVASPPAASLDPGQKYVVRIVRVSGKPVEGEESYRLLVDDLPQPSDDAGTRVNFKVRYSIPIFVAQGGANPQLVWSAVSAKDKLRITLRNDGTRHIRISALNVEDTSGLSVSFGNGLVGYVLAHSTMHWTVPVGKMTPGATLTITAQGNNGQLTATTVLESTRQ